VEELFTYVRKLVDIPSVSGDEGEVGRFLAKDLEARGFSVTTQEVAPGRANVYAVQGSVAPRVVFCTHIDTVPAFFASSEDDSYIHGRGSCDAKGILATMVFATMALREQGIEDVGLLFVVGEEVDSIGAFAANDLPSSSSRYVIVGEPTENKMATGHKGGFKFRMHASGKAAHSAYPKLGHSAIEHLLDGLAALRNESFGVSDTLGPATINIGTIHGGLAANVFAPDAVADVLVRVVGAKEEVEAKINAVVERYPHLRYEVISQSDAVLCETVAGFDTAPVSFGTDIPALHAFGKALLLGPGSIHDAHTIGEKLGKDEAVDAVGYYQKLVKQLLAKS